MNLLLAVLFIGIPSAPLYIGAVLLLWWAISRHFSGTVALVVAVSLVVATAIIVPLVANLPLEHRFRQAVEHDRQAGHVISPMGDVQIEVYDPWPDARDRELACGSFCQSLLALPRITSVTIVPSATQPSTARLYDAVSFRRGVSACDLPKPTRSAEGVTLVTPAGWHAPSLCVNRAPPVRRPALRIVTSREEQSQRGLRSSFYMERASLTNTTGTILFQQTRASAEPLTIPLLIEFTFDQHDGPFMFARSRRDTGRQGKPWYPGNLLLRAINGQDLGGLLQANGS